jgi:hypothetical protein
MQPHCAVVSRRKRLGMVQLGIGFEVTLKLVSEFFPHYVMGLPMCAGVAVLSEVVRKYMKSEESSKNCKAHSL